MSLFGHTTPIRKTVGFSKFANDNPFATNHINKKNTLLQNIRPYEFKAPTNSIRHLRPPQPVYKTLPKLNLKSAFASSYKRPIPIKKDEVIKPLPKIIKLTPKPLVKPTPKQEDDIVKVVETTPILEQTFKDKIISFYQSNTKIVRLFLTSLAIILLYMLYRKNKKNQTTTKKR